MTDAKRPASGEGGPRLNSEHQQRHSDSIATIAVQAPLAMGARARLPNRRLSESFTVECGGLRYVATISRLADGRVAEIFLSNHKSGSQADANARDSAVVCSLALQHGVPLDVIRRALLRDPQGRPSTPLGAAIDVVCKERAP
jgi:hypothetical protein